MKTFFIFLVALGLALIAHAQPAGLNLAPSLLDVQPDGTIHILPYQILGDTFQIDPQDLTGANPTSLDDGLNHTGEAVFSGFDGTNLQTIGGSSTSGVASARALPTFSEAVINNLNTLVSAMFDVRGGDTQYTIQSLSWNIVTDGNGYILINYTISATSSYNGLQSQSGSINTNVNAWALPVWAQIQQGLIDSGFQGAAGTSLGDILAENNEESSYVQILMSPGVVAIGDPTVTIGEIQAANDDPYYYGNDPAPDSGDYGGSIGSC